MTTILLLGLDDVIAQKVEQTIGGDYTVIREPFRQPCTGLPNADVIFLAGDDPRYLAALRSLVALDGAPPIVVLTRLPQINIWLDALEAGATDYCAQPFEPQTLEWALSMVPKEQKVAA